MWDAPAFRDVPTHQHNERLKGANTGGRTVMPALKYLPEIIVTLHGSKVPAADVGRYEAHCLALSQPCLTLPCPY